MIQCIPLPSNVIEDDDDLSNEELTLSIIPLLFEIDMDYTEQHTELPQELQMYNYKKYAPTLCHICNKKISNVNAAKHRKICNKKHYENIISIGNYIQM